jgi:endonuclease/exonuclease/phosphatase family metal-dependent hydrolase
MILLPRLIRSLYCFLYLFFISQCSFGQGTISVASWNLENFGQTKSANTLMIIAETVHDYDILAIQEVVGNTGGMNAVSRLTAVLNSKSHQGYWKYVVSPKTTGTPSQSERYAFIWNSKKIHLIGKAWLDKHFAEAITREPFMGTFASGEDTFTLVTIHALPKKRQPEREIKYLKFFPANYPKLNLIFLGDFNTPQNNNVLHPLKKMGYQSALVNQKTTLKMNCIQGQCLASEYDNVFYNSSRIRMVYSSILPFYKHFQSMVAARKVSDHVPVAFTFKIP